MRSVTASERLTLLIAAPSYSPISSAISSTSTIERNRISTSSLLPPGGGGARLVVSPTSLYVVRTPDYGIIGFLDGPLTSEER